MNNETKKNMKSFFILLGSFISTIILLAAIFIPTWLGFSHCFLDQEKALIADGYYQIHPDQTSPTQQQILTGRGLGFGIFYSIIIFLLIGNILKEYFLPRKS